MSLTRLFIVMIAVSLAWTAPRVNAQETTVSARGAITVMDWFRLNADARREARQSVKVNALENYIAEGGVARQRLYEQHRQTFVDNIDRYVLSTTTLSEEEDRKAKTFTLVVRAQINAALVQATLDSGSATAAARQDQRSLLTFVFVARQQDTAQSFNDTTSGRVDASRSYDEKTNEGENIRRDSVGTTGNRDQAATVALTRSGSVTRQSDKITWKVANANEVDTAMTGLFSGAGYEVVGAEYVDGVSLDLIRNDFGAGDDLSAATLRATADGARTAGIPYLAYGTLDVGIRDRDPVTGNVRVPVTVTGKLLDVTGRFPKTVSSVGPVLYIGLGADENIARTNALNDAAAKTARQMINELNVRDVR
ncbi:MAG: hypothetical protein LBE59_03735 [Nevskiaceae bacterium]|jgi:hypothetical protein|nr:hypothetical protein [Nevskiaceae bacterium]